MEDEAQPKPEKHSLDSDEENSADEDEKANVLEGSDIEGEEEGVPGMEGEVKFTPFNLKEELEEGHFDKSGHFHWDKTKEVRDDWLDSIDWVQIKNKPDNRKRRHDSDSSDSDSDARTFDPKETYSAILKYMKPHENVRMTLIRLGKSTKKLSSVERLRRKKAGINDDDSGLVTEFTRLTNEILYRTGNTNIYEESYAAIQNKLNPIKSNSSGHVAPLDMYADDFETKEKNLQTSEKAQEHSENSIDASIQQWEFKWEQSDEKVHGPFCSEKMQEWKNDDYFKSGVYVRKVGEERFYHSNRIDFDLYL